MTIRCAVTDLVLALKRVKRDLNTRFGGMVRRSKY